MSSATMEERERERRVENELGKKGPFYRSLQIQPLCADPARPVLPLVEAVVPLWIRNLPTDLPRGLEAVVPLAVPLAVP